MLTVVIATHNGARTLPEVLNAFCGVRSPQGGWKLVVVDNASADRTKEIIDSFASRLPLTYVFEPVPGKSRAQNAGLRHASGDLVLLTDDDAVPDADWLAQMRSAADAQRSFSLFGGCIIPRWEVPPESWILKIDGSILTITDPAWAEGPIPPTRLYGPNMAVRSDVLAAGIEFDTSLGPVGRRYRMGEDTDFVQRIGKAGFKAWYCKRAIVAHMIRSDQMKKEWVLRRAFPLGRATYRREFIDCRTSPKLLLGVPRYLVREVLSQAIRLGRARFSRHADEVFKEYWQLRFLLGRAAEGRALANDRAAKPRDGFPS